MSVAENIDRSAIEPLPYQIAIRDFLKTEEREVWDWFASNKVREDQADAVRFDLLKSTYRIDRQTHPHLYEAADAAATKLGLDVPITIYQAQNPIGSNASLAYIPNEAHIVLHGPIASKLNEHEVRALFGHELGHLLLWQGWDGEFLIVDQLLAALTLDAKAQVSHIASARLFGLYTEIFCDRASLTVVGDPTNVVATLVKVATELDVVSAESYIRQADEIFSRESAKTDQLTHPEAFIRARAVKLWADQDQEADAKIKQMIEGSPCMDDLDLLGQQHMSALTRRLIGLFISPKWFQTDNVIAHAKLFFDGFDPSSANAEDEKLKADIENSDKSVQDYFCYVLLDFVTADRDLEELPLASALTLCERFGLKTRFAEIARKELRLRKKQFEKIDKAKNELLAKAAREE